MEDAWQLVMALSWEAYRVGSLPIGAVVVDVEGRVVSSARSRRHEDVPVIGQLSGTRIAHAEVNALAQLPVSGRYGEHTVCVNVEPCCLCMGAVWQTGIGSVRYGWRDRYGGAASCMTVANPQVLCRPLSVHGPAGGLVEALTGLLLACHYRYLRPGLDHVTRPWQQAQPDIFAAAADPRVATVLSRAVASGLSVEGLVTALEPVTGLRLRRTEGSAPLDWV